METPIQPIDSDPRRRDQRRKPMSFLEKQEHNPALDVPHEEHSCPIDKDSFTHKEVNVGSGSYANNPNLQRAIRKKANESLEE
jgi:hypothetical protein